MISQNFWFPASKFLMRTSMEWNITSSQKDLHSMHGPAASMQTSFLQRKPSLPGWNSLTSSDTLTPLRLPHCTWSRSLVEVGDLVVIFVASTTLADNRYPLPHVQDFNANLAGATIFSNLTSFVATNGSQWPSRISPRQQSSRHLAYGNSIVYPSVSKMLDRLFRG